ncbi:DUF1648 domain-containing protein [Microbacterium sp. SS28]|uniref:DUF1648 domain-containing protein n=1 Tax=Microbacterium sp. SS28 TaxID=2919948 RepID=UPI001FAA20F0|nr:DUF1648 domain-containing protein [Microbacterium sp. SS28]
MAADLSHAPDRSDAAELRRARRRFVLVGVVVPLVATLGGVVLMLVWLPQLPDPVAVHWSGGGEADGFASASLTIVLTALVGVGLTALFALPVLIASREGEWAPAMRFLGALSAGTTVYLVALMTWSLGMQRGLADAHDAPSILPALIGGLVLGLAIGAAAWLAQPRVALSGGRGPRTTAAEPLALAPGERAVWLRTVTMPRAGMIGVVAATAVFAIAALWLAVTGGGELAVMFALLAVLFVVLLLTTTVFRIRIDDAGLAVRSAVGIPRWHVPLSSIESVAVTRIDPMVQFGGWGIRLGTDGRFGVVLQRGDAIQVGRAGKRPLVVTVEDAATGAALLQALVDRSRADSAVERG